LDGDGCVSGAYVAVFCDVLDVVVPVSEYVHEV
jgi:hypothetical protein